MNRRTFFATLAAPFIARFLPKPEPAYIVRGLSPDGEIWWDNYAAAAYSWSAPCSSPIADIERAMKLIREHPSSGGET